MPEDLNVGGIKDRASIISLNAYWKDWRYDYDGGGNLVYIGTHYIHNSATTDTNWEIKKYTYGANGITRQEGPLQGAWDSRSSLNWG